MKLSDLISCVRGDIRIAKSLPLDVRRRDFPQRHFYADASMVFLGP